MGALACSQITDPGAWGWTARPWLAFLGLLWPRLKGRDPVAIAVVASLATVVAMPFVPPGIPVVLAAVVTGGWWGCGAYREGDGMSLWPWVLLAAVTAYALKLFGYLLPQSMLDRPGSCITSPARSRSGYWARLTILNTVGGRGYSIVLDSRLLALAAGAVALKLKAPYIVVVIVGALRRCHRTPRRPALIPTPAAAADGAEDQQDHSQRVDAEHHPDPHSRPTEQFGSLAL